MPKASLSLGERGKLPPIGEWRNGVLENGKMDGHDTDATKFQGRMWTTDCGLRTDPDSYRERTADLTTLLPFIKFTLRPNPHKFIFLKAYVAGICFFYTFAALKNSRKFYI
nr:hypothetical protein [Bacteroidota bacterium]